MHGMTLELIDLMDRRLCRLGSLGFESAIGDAKRFKKEIEMMFRRGLRRIRSSLRRFINTGAAGGAQEQPMEMNVCLLELRA